jgi:hypothetical protein
VSAFGYGISDFIAAHPGADRCPGGGSDRLHPTPPTANRTHHHTITHTTDNQPRPTKPPTVLNPVATVALAMVVLKERVTRWQAVGIVLALLAVGMIATG